MYHTDNMVIDHRVLAGPIFHHSMTTPTSLYSFTQHWLAFGMMYRVQSSYHRAGDAALFAYA